MQVNILGIEVLFESYNKILAEFWDANLKTFTCANHHYLNISYNDPNYRENLIAFDIIHADGLGAKLAADILGNDGNVERITGSDFYPVLLEEVCNRKLPVYILGDSEIVLIKAVQKIRELFPGLIITGSHHGFIDLNDKTIVEEINRANPFLLLVGLGAPKQEAWVARWKDELNVNKIMVIGGWLRVISGDRKRGPVWIREMGLEWLVRLLSEPQKSWKRYVIGIPLFVYRVILQRMFSVTFCLPKKVTKKGRLK